MNKFIYILLFLLTYSNGYGQVFLNSDLNGSVNYVSTPTSWLEIPFSDPICQANTAVEATVDILGATGPSVSSGVAGIPFTGTTFCSGLHSTDGGAFLWHEGIMQTVNGFTIGNSYTINFNQAVVKQENALDESGSWRIYLDGVLIGTSAVSTSNLLYDDINLQWDCRSMTFNATATSHTIKFIPWDDDANLLSNLVDITGALRMGIDQIEFTIPIDPTITSYGPFCASDPPVNLTAADPSGVWAGTGITDPVNGTFDPSIVGVGSHGVTYTITTPCGIFTDNVLIIVGELSYSSSNADESCGAGNGQITLTPNLGIGPYSYSIDAGSTSQGTGVFSGLTANSYDILIVDNATGCSVTGVETIANSTAPTVDSTSFIDPTCSGLCDGSFSVYSSTGILYSITGGASNSTGTFNSMCNGTYEIMIEDAGGCSALVQVSLSSSSGVSSSFGYNPGFITPTENLVNLFNTSSGASSFIWEINGPNGFYDVYDFNISNYVFPTTVGAYEVCLIAENIIGCQDTTCASIVMQEEFTIFIPNSFTPNHDEFNHSLVISINGIDSYNFEMTIYNRWGQVVFQTKDKDHYWDGTYNGARVQDGSYNWKIVVKDVNQDNYQEFTGHVNVLK